MLCNFEPNFVEKIPLGKCFFNFWLRDVFCESKIRFLATILISYRFLKVFCFCWNMIIISVCTYGVKIISKFRWESGFLKGGFHGTPLIH